MVSVKNRVLEYIKRFGSINTFQAFMDLGCTRLSEYIRQLRLEYNIQDEWINGINRFGEKIKYKNYYMKEGK
jgi:hypothetical protein